MKIKLVSVLMVCSVLVTLLCGCSFALPVDFFNKSSSNIAEPSVQPSSADIVVSEDDNYKPPIEEVIEWYNSEIEKMSDEDKKELGLDGMQLRFELTDNKEIIYKVWIDGFAGLVYNASVGDATALEEYNAFIQSNVDEMVASQEPAWFEDYGIKYKDIAMWIMNDVNPDNVLVIIKNGQVLYETVYGVNLIDLGAETK